MSTVVGSPLEITAPLRSLSAGRSATTTPWVVLMCKFSDIPDEPQNAAFFQDLFTESGAGKGGMFDYWRAMSGGAITLAGSEVHGWFPMSLSLTTAQSWTWPAARYDLMLECIKAAKAEVDVRPFYGIVAVVNAVIDSGSAGRRTLPLDGTSKTYGLVNLDPLAWFNTFAAHEMGHGYGLPHSFSADPTVQEYGDGWDIMSALTFGGRSPEFSHPVFGRSGPGLSAAYRDRLGWIPYTQRLDLSSFSGGSTITISALDPIGPNIRLVRVWLGFSTQYYAVELRIPTPTGWDRRIGRAGVLVRRVQDGVSYLRQARSGVYDLQPGDSFVDASENVVVSVLGIDSSAGTATLHIGPLPPATLITSARLTPLANAAGWHNEDVEVALSAATGVGSQVSEITYSATGENPLPPTTVPGRLASFQMREEGLTTVIYAAKDSSGAGELPRKLEVRVDKTPPTTTQAVSSTSPGVVEIELNGSDQPLLSDFKHLQYEAVGANPIPPTTSTQRRVRFSITASGQTTVFYWSTDNADNVEGPHSLTLRPLPVVTPSSLAFVALPGSVSAPRTLLLSNTGQTALGISGIATSDFAFVASTSGANPCGPTLNPGATCTIDVVFAPLVATVYNASLLISTNASSTPITVPLTGTGATARLEFDPASLTFPATQIRQISPPLTATVRNVGEVPLVISDVTSGDDYFVSQNGCGPFPRTLQPGQSCGVDIAFRPRGAGLRPGGLMVTSNVPGGPRVLPLEGEGLAVPELTIAPTTLVFGGQPLGTTGAALQVELTNTGTADLRITGASVGGVHAADFTIVGGTCLPAPVVVLQPEESCHLETTFRPTTLGPRVAELLLATNVPGPPQRIPLIGEGTATPVITLDPTSVDFGPQAVAAPGPTMTVTLTNNGAAPIEIRSAEATGDAASDFAVASDTCSSTTIPTGGTCTVGVAFTPTNVGSRIAVLTLTDATGARHDAALSGTGTGALVTFDPTSVDFGALPLGGTERRDVSVRNAGNTVLTVTGISATGDFLHGPGCGGGVAPGSYCTLRVVFRPTGAGPRNGELVVTSNALGAPHRLPLVGVGLVPAISISTSDLVFGTQGVGTASSAQSVTVSSTGTAPLSIDEVVLAGAHPGDFRLQDGCGWRGHQPGSSCAIEVVFAPSASGTRTATLTIRDNAPGNPHTVTLTGSAT